MSTDGQELIINVDGTKTHEGGTGGTNGIQDVFSTVPRNFEGVMAFCEMLAKSDLVPKDYKEKPANVMVAIQCGAEIGLSPMQAIQNIAVINGRPCLWGDAPLALVQGSGKLEWIKEWDDGTTAYCETKRRGYPQSYKTSFSQDDAKRMGLAGKQGPWQQNPARMRQFRCRGFNLRDQYSDVLKGASIAEEVIDITPPSAEPQQPEPPPAPTTQAEKGKAVRDKIKSKVTPKTDYPEPVDDLAISLEDPHVREQTLKELKQDIETFAAVQDELGMADPGKAKPHELADFVRAFQAKQKKGVR